MKKRALYRSGFVVAIVGLLVGLLSPSSAHASFNDVGPTDPFSYEINWFAAQGITDGFNNGTEYRPKRSVTRQEMAAFLYRLAGEPSVTYGSTPRFRDVPAGHQFRRPIEWMAQQGISTGYPGGVFKPTENVTREAMAAFIWRYRGEPGYALSSPRFRDVGNSNQFRRPIEWLAFVGVTTGYAGNTFRPKDHITREAMAAFIFRYHTIFTILRETNQYRASQGLPPLQLSRGINPVARNWSKHMHDRCDFRHNPNYSSQIPSGWTLAGENIAAGQHPDQVTTDWWNSPGHKANILGDFTHIGIGIHVGSRHCSNFGGRLYTFYTQVFAKY